MRDLILYSMLITGVLISCAPHVPPQQPDDAPLASIPPSRSTHLVEEIVDKSFDYQIKQILDLPRQVRRLVGKPYEALDVDAYDEVHNSSWFTQRIGYETFSPEQIRRGPNRSTGPDTTGLWTVLSLKTAGVTPGMTIVDARGDRYIIKFDPPAYAELASATEVIATRLLHASGYNVPENYIAYLNPERLVPGDNARLALAKADKRPARAKRPLTREDLQLIVARANPSGAKRVRVLASRFLPGRPIGPWPYIGVRTGDANDRYPHEHMRALRSLYVIASWLNHADMKEENTLDIFDENTRTVRHYLIDFGAAMGSNSTGPSNPRRGQANSFDLKDSLLRLFTLGLYVPAYERAQKTVHFSSIGYVQNELFNPGAWKPMYPNPAFENLTQRDAFWGARIATAFSNAHIRAAVMEGRLSNSDAAAALELFLRQRRDAIGRYWFARTNPLDQFCATKDSLYFSDLAIDRGFADAATTHYVYNVTTGAGKKVATGSTTQRTLVLMKNWALHEKLIIHLNPERPHMAIAPLRVYLHRRDESWAVGGVSR
ncbi:MAG: hypothetical protein ACI906_000969 [Candidatus Latescibacterota bacterium]|jgi:hypothetical protein